MLRATTPVERVLLLGAAAALIVPGLYTDLTGFGLLGFTLVIQSLRGRRETAGAIAPSLD